MPYYICHCSGPHSTPLAGDKNPSQGLFFSQTKCPIYIVLVQMSALKAIGSSRIMLSETDVAAKAKVGLKDE